MNVEMSYILRAYENGDLEIVKEYLENCTNDGVDGAADALDAYHTRDWETVKCFIECQAYNED